MTLLREKPEWQGYSEMKTFCVVLCRFDTVPHKCDEQTDKQAAIVTNIYCFAYRCTANMNRYSSFYLPKNDMINKLKINKTGQKCSLEKHILLGQKGAQKGHKTAAVH